MMARRAASRKLNASSIISVWPRPERAHADAASPTLVWAAGRGDGQTCPDGARHSRPLPPPDVRLCETGYGRVLDDSSACPLRREHDSRCRSGRRVAPRDGSVWRKSSGAYAPQHPDVIRVACPSEWATRRQPGPVLRPSQIAERSRPPPEWAGMAGRVHNPGDVRRDPPQGRCGRY